MIHIAKVIDIHPDLNMIVRKHAIIIETKHTFEPNPLDKGIAYHFDDDPEQFKQFVDAFKTAADEAWANFTPKNADSYGADYFEYYDRVYDNNGYLTLSPKGSIMIEAPYGSTQKIYQFNKHKAQSFVYDLDKCLQAVN